MLDEAGFTPAKTWTDDQRWFNVSLGMRTKAWSSRRARFLNRAIHLSAGGHAQGTVVGWLNLLRRANS